MFDQSFLHPFDAKYRSATAFLILLLMLFFAQLLGERFYKIHF